MLAWLDILEMESTIIVYDCCLIFNYKHYNINRKDIWVAWKLWKLDSQNSRQRLLLVWSETSFYVEVVVISKYIKI